MKTATRLIALAVFLSGTFFVSSALACTTTLWTSATAGALADDPTNGVPRVSGLCGLEVTGTGHVVDASPAAEATVIARFYVYAQLTSGTPVIFEAFSDNAATASLLTVTFDGTNFVFDAGATASANVPGKSGWNLVELAWTGGTDMDYWVNADASTDGATGSVGAAAGTMESVVLGATAAVDGKLIFDDYESHRSLPVGALLMGDANGNGSLTIADAIALFNELNLANQTLAPGQPDCNESGGITIADAICLFNKL